MDHTPRVPSQEEMLRRICGEYLEMPGLRLKREQAQRLWGLDTETCSRLLDVLVASGFLCRHLDGGYGRRTDGAVSVPVFHMAKSTGTPRQSAQRRAKSPAA